MPTKMKAGVIGLGFLGQEYVNLFSIRDDVDLIAV